MTLKFNKQTWFCPPQRNCRLTHPSLVSNVFLYPQLLAIYPSFPVLPVLAYVIWWPDYGQTRQQYQVALSKSHGGTEQTGRGKHRAVLDRGHQDLQPYQQIGRASCRERV